MERMTRVSFLQRLTLIAIAIATVVCAGIFGAGRLTSSAPAAAVVTASAVQASQQWRAGDDPADIDRDAIEAERDDDNNDDDDVDARGHAIAAAFGSLRGRGSPRCPGRALRSEPPTDTSRFACGIGLPRGPPV